MFFRCATFKLADSRLNIFTRFFFREIRFNSRNQVIKAFITDGSVISAIVVRSTIACDQWTKTCPATFNVSNCNIRFWEAVVDNTKQVIYIFLSYFWMFQITCVVCIRCTKVSLVFTWENKDHTAITQTSVKVNWL